MQLLRSLARRSASSPRWVMIIAIVLMAASVFFALRLRVSTDISSLMPGNSRISGTLLQVLDDFGTTDRLILAIESSHSLEPGFAERRRELREMADRVASAMVETGLFISVNHRITAEQRSYFEELYFSHPFHYHSSGNLASLKSRLSRQEIQGRVAELGNKLRVSPFGAASQKQILRDPLGFRENDPAPGYMGGFTLDMSDGYFFSRDGSFVLIIAKPVIPSQDTAFDAELLQAIEDLLAANGGTGTFSPEFSMNMGNGVELRLLGPYVETLYGSTTAAREVVPAIIVTCLGLLALFFAVYRNLRPLLILALPLLTGIALTSGISSLFVGHLTMITVGFAVMLAGLGVDFGIHLLERIGQESERGDGLRESISRAYETTGRGVLAGALTSAAIFLLIATSDFAALQEFGWIIAMGILLTVLSMFLLVPALLVSLPPPAPSRRKSLNSNWPTWVVKHYRGLIVSAAVLSLALGYAASLLELESNIYELGPVNSSYEEEKDRLLEKAAGSTNVVMLVAEQQELQALLELLERVDARLEKLKAAGEIQSYESLSALLPSAGLQGEARRIVSGWNLDESMTTFEESLLDAGFRTEAFDPFVAHVLAYLSPGGNAISLDDLEGTPAEEFVDRFLLRLDHGWRAISYIYPETGQWEDEVPPEIVESLESFGGEVIVTGIVPSFGEIARLTRHEFLKLTYLALMLVLLISLLFLRQPLLAVLAVLPAVLGLLWTLGLMKLVGIELNLITILVAPMILGLGIDDALHVLNRYREDPASLVNTMSAVSGAVLMTTATTVIGFGSLVFARIPSLQSLGLTVSIGMLCCALTSLVLLPALLRAIAARR